MTGDDKFVLVLEKQVFVMRISDKLPSTSTTTRTIRPVSIGSNL